MLHYGVEPPTGNTVYERQGVVGMRQAAHHLRNQGMLNVSFNQDRNNEEKQFPDLAYYNPTKHQYEFDEVKNLINTPRLEKSFVQEQVVAKTHILNVPLSLTLIHRKPIDPGAEEALTKTGIPIINGLPVESVFHSDVSWGGMEEGCNGNLMGYSDISSRCYDYGGPPRPGTIRWKLANGVKLTRHEAWINWRAIVSRRAPHVASVTEAESVPMLNPNLLVNSEKYGYWI